MSISFMLKLQNDKLYTVLHAQLAFGIRNAKLLLEGNTFKKQVKTNIQPYKAISNII